MLLFYQGKVFQDLTIKKLFLYFVGFNILVNKNIYVLLKTINMIYLS